MRYLLYTESGASAPIETLQIGYSGDITYNLGQKHFDVLGASNSNIFSPSLTCDQIRDDPSRLIGQRIRREDGFYTERIISVVEQRSHSEFVMRHLKEKTLKIINEVIRPRNLSA
jgi:hypothetical protein